MFSLLFPFVLFLFPVEILCQQFVVKNYNLDDGISSNVVFDVVQDKDGNMWFATDTGVSVYNTKTWKNFDIDDGLPEGEYFSLKFDKENKLWAIPYNSRKPISFYSNNRWHQLNVGLPSSSQKIEFIKAFEIIYENNNRILCYGTDNGLFLLNENKWINLTIKDGLADNRINNLCKVEDKLYICTDKGLAYYSKGKIFNVHFNSPSRQILAAYVSVKDKNTIWLMGDHWIGKLVNQHFVLLYKGNDHIFANEDQRHKFILYDDVEKIYCGNEFEMYCFDLKQKLFSNMTQDNGFVTSGCSKAFLDSESNLWFCTYRGIDKISNKRFLNYFKTNRLLDNEVTAILEVRKDYLIFGHNKGLTIYKDGEFSTIDFQKYSNNKMIVRRVMSICKDKNNNIWVAASHLGIGKLVNNGIEWTRKQAEGLSRFNAVIADNNNTIWAGSEEGLYKIENNKLIRMFANDIHNNVRKLYLDSNNTLYAALPTCFIKFSNNQFQKYDEKVLKDASNVFSIYEYDNSTLLIGSKKGLFIMDKDNSIKSFNVEKFQVKKPVYDINKAKDNSLWFGTNDGVIKWDGKEPSYYNIENGLTGREINRSAIINDSYGNIWIGTNKGLSCYLPEYDRQDDIDNVVLCSIMDSDGIPIKDLNKEINLPSPINELVFHFRAMSFVNESEVRYKVLLQGFDNKWIDNGKSNTIRYTNLKPGQYKFLVMAKNMTGKWSRVFSSNTIIVNKQFYMQWWFLVILLFIITVIIYLIYNYRFHIKYSIQLEKEVELRTDKLKKSQYELQQSNLAKDKFFSIIAHDLKSPFQGLLGIINFLSARYDDLDEYEKKESIGIIKSSTTKLFELISQLLEWSRLQTGNIELDPTDFDFNAEVIIPSISLLKVNADTKEISIQNKLNNNVIVKADINSYRMIVDNLLSNAIKFTKEGGRIIIDFVENVKYYEINIIDTGIGISREKIDRLFQVGENVSSKGTSGEEGTGLGLILCKELLENNGNTISVYSEPNKGTTFTFTIDKSDKA